jgi:hypothetical protein
MLRVRYELKESVQGKLEEAVMKAVSAKIPVGA